MKLQSELLDQIVKSANLFVSFKNQIFKFMLFILQTLIVLLKGLVIF